MPIMSMTEHGIDHDRGLGGLFQGVHDRVGHDHGVQLVAVPDDGVRDRVDAGHEEAREGRSEGKSLEGHVRLRR